MICKLVTALIVIIFSILSILCVIELIRTVTYSDGEEHSSDEFCSKVIVLIIFCLSFGSVPLTFLGVYLHGPDYYWFHPM